MAISLPKTALFNYSRDIQKKISFVPLCCCRLLVNNEVPICFFEFKVYNDKINRKLLKTIFLCKGLVILLASNRICDMYE